MTPTMIVLAGPNGAGKSTLYQTRVAPSFAGPFINADVIQRDELCDPSPAASYEAARIASSRRADYLSRGRDFVTETVFSDPSKLELIDEARSKDSPSMSASIRQTSLSRVSVRASRKAAISSLWTRSAPVTSVARHSFARRSP